MNISCSVAVSTLDITILFEWKLCPTINTRHISTTHLIVKGECYLKPTWKGSVLIDSLPSFLQGLEKIKKPGNPPPSPGEDEYLCL